MRGITTRGRCALTHDIHTQTTTGQHPDGLKEPCLPSELAAAAAAAAAAVKLKGSTVHQMNQYTLEWFCTFVKMRKPVCVSLHSFAPCLSFKHLTSPRKGQGPCHSLLLPRHPGHKVLFACNQYANSVVKSVSSVHLSSQPPDIFLQRLCETQTEAGTDTDSARHRHRQRKPDSAQCFGEFFLPPYLSKLDPSFLNGARRQLGRRTSYGIIPNLKLQDLCLSLRTALG